MFLLSINLLIVFLINGLVVWSMKCQKKLGNVDQFFLSNFSYKLLQSKVIKVVKYFGAKIIILIIEKINRYLNIYTVKVKLPK